MVEIGLGFIIQIYYDSEICKNYLKIIGQKKQNDGNDITTEVAKHERNNIKRCTSVFSNIQNIDVGNKLFNEFVTQKIRRKNVSN